MIKEEDENLVSDNSMNLLTGYNTSKIANDNGINITCSSHMGSVRSYSAFRENPGEGDEKLEQE